MELLKPFAVNGEREDFSVDTDPDGKVSLDRGFTQLYELKPTEGGLFILRRIFNQMMYLVTNDAVKWKTQTFADWIADKGDGTPYPYPKNSIVKYTDGNSYVSKVDNNTTLPTDTDDWVNFEDFGGSDRIGLIDYGYVAKSYHIVAFGGEFNRADYPKLWAYLQSNPSLVKTQTQWQTEATANGGMCGFFSDGNGTTTFRVPNLDKAFLRPDSRGVGSYQKGTVIGANNDASAASEIIGNGVDNGNSESIGADSAILAQYPNLKEGVLEGAAVRSATIFDTHVTRPKNIAVLPLIVAK